MDKICGNFNSAVIYTSNSSIPIDKYAVAQIKMLCDNPISEGSKIRIMPDVHPGKVGTIGLTMTVGASLMPNLLGIDIGCGMSLLKLKDKRVEFERLDKVIRSQIPSGFHIRDKAHRFAERFDFEKLHCARHINKDKAMRSISTLGGGNHFIEIDKDDQGSFYAVIHSGSRHLGKEVTEHYLREGQKYLKSKGIEVPYELTYLESELLKQYLHDIALVQEYAELNRQAILDEMMKGMKWKEADSYSCIHNYVDSTPEILDCFEAPMLRKGAISAKHGEKVIIPMNMRDGIILGTGLGNPDWNYSAPHGAGRIMKREDVKKNYTLSAFKKDMKGIHCTCISQDTLDESPFAYRTLEDMLEIVKNTITIDKVIQPVFNYKAGGN